MNSLDYFLAWLLAPDPADEVVRRERERVAWALGLDDDELRREIDAEVARRVTARALERESGSDL